MLKSPNSWEKQLKDDKWPEDARLIDAGIDTLRQSEIPRPHTILQEILDLYLASPLSAEAEDEELERDIWHPLRNTQAGLARQLGVSRPHLNSMANSKAPVGLKFAKVLYTWCRRAGMRREAWRLRLSYDFWGALGARNPNRTRYGGTRKPIYLNPGARGYQMDNLKKRQLREQLLLEARLARKELVNLTRLK